LIEIGFPLEESQKMLSKSPFRRRAHTFSMENAIFLTVIVQIVLWTDEVWAQPVRTGSQIPVALWFIGAGVLGVVLAYAIVHNRKRSRSEKQVTEQGTKKVYAEEDRVARTGSTHARPTRPPN
jgi:hypothetical protein